MDQSQLSASSVHFTPGGEDGVAHPSERPNRLGHQGIGLCQRRGGPVEVIRPGDRVFFEPGADHWHGAAPDRFITHLAMVEVDDEGNPQRGFPRTLPSGLEPETFGP